MVPVAWLFVSLKSTSWDGARGGVCRLLVFEAFRSLGFGGPTRVANIA